MREAGTAEKILVWLGCGLLGLLILGGGFYYYAFHLDIGFGESIRSQYNATQLECLREALCRANKGLQLSPAEFSKRIDSDNRVWFPECLQGIQLSDLPQLCSIEPLQGLKLYAISLSLTNITDLSPLIGMPLSTAELMFCPVEDITPLAGLPLNHVLLSGSKTKDLSPLCGMKLRMLSVEHIPAQDWTVLEKISIESLCCDLSHISTETLKKIKTLQSLSISMQQQATLEKLRGLKLDELSLDEISEPVDLAPLADVSVQTLRLSHLSVLNLKPLAKTQLTDLTLDEVPVDDLSPLRGLPLTSLSLNKIKLPDLTPLQDLKLERLDLFGASVTVADLQPLLGRQIENIIIRGTPAAEEYRKSGQPLPKGVTIE